MHPRDAGLYIPFLKKYRASVETDAYIETDWPNEQSYSALGDRRLCKGALTRPTFLSLANGLEETIPENLELL